MRFPWGKAIFAIPRDAEECISDVYLRVWERAALYDTEKGLFSCGAREQRGYVLYRIQLPGEWINGNTCLNYGHAYSPFSLPFQTAGQKILSGTTEFRQHVGMFQLLPPDHLE